MDHYYKAEQVIEYVATIDFLNTNGTLEINFKNSGLFKNITEGLDEEHIALLADAYTKQISKLEIVSENSLSKIALLQFNKGLENERKIKKTNAKAENYELVYVETYPESSKLPDNNQIIQRLKAYGKLDNYYGELFRQGDIVVIHNKDKQETTAYFFDGKSLSKMDNFLSRNLLNKILTNYHVEAEAYLFRTLARHESHANMRILSGELTRRYELLKAYGKDFIVNYLLSRQTKDFDYKNCYSLSKSKVLLYNSFRNELDINNVKDLGLRHKVFLPYAVNTEKYSIKQKSRKQWKKLIGELATELESAKRRIESMNIKNENSKRSVLEDR
ncbi:MAG TPA: hypothetical protein PLC16_07490 [Defluviitaleaceae bacterium]|nr:hypothetical protein [Defluviitaleaceae bacterium]